MNKSATRLMKIRHQPMTWTAARMLINAEPDEMKRCILFASYARQHCSTLDHEAWHQLRNAFARPQSTERAERIALHTETVIAWLETDQYFNQPLSLS